MLGFLQDLQQAISGSSVPVALLSLAPGSAALPLVRGMALDGQGMQSQTLQPADS